MPAANLTVTQMDCAAMEDTHIVTTENDMSTHRGSKSVWLLVALYLKYLN